MTFTPPGEDPPTPPPAAPPPAPPAPGWWLASDGNWYPPEAKPGVPMSYGAPPAYGPPPNAYAPGGSPYGYTPYQPQRSTNGLATASLVLGILGWLYFVPALLAVIFGHTALSQIKRTGQGGRGLALAGVILGWIWLALFVLIIVVAVASNT